MDFANRDYLTKLKDCRERETVYEIKSHFLLACRGHSHGHDISEVEYTYIFLKNNLKLEEKHAEKCIGTKPVQTRPMIRGAYNRYRGWEIPADENPEDEGYLVQYPDGYASWSPKEMFDHSHLEVDDNPQLPSGVNIRPGIVEAFIDRIKVMKPGERTTVVRCTLKNGFELIESSACVDPKDYSVEIGQEAYMEKVRDRVWNLLGFLLRTVWIGVRKDEGTKG